MREKRTIGHQKFSSKDEIVEYARSNHEHCRVKDIDWYDSGWYVIQTWSQPCPRGCCYDNCVGFYPVSTIINEIVDNIRSLCYDLKEYRSLIKE